MKLSYALAHKEKILAHKLESKATLDQINISKFTYKSSKDSYGIR